MAKQKGVIKVTGTLDNVTYFKYRERYFLRKKTRIDAERFKSDPVFGRSRENSNEFRTAVVAGALLRGAIRPLLRSMKDGKMNSRMLQVMIRILQEDTTHARGQRTVGKGGVDLLEGFECNGTAHLSEVLSVPLQCSINRATGSLLLDIPSFVPATLIKAPAGATHFKIVSAGVAVDFDAGVEEAELKESVALPINGLPTGALQLVHTVPYGVSSTLLLVAGVQFLQELNGRMYGLKNLNFNPLKVVKVG